MVCNRVFNFHKVADFLAYNAYKQAKAPIEGRNCSYAAPTKTGFLDDPKSLKKPVFMRFFTTWTFPFLTFVGVVGAKNIK